MTLRELVVHCCGENADGILLLPCLADLTVKNVDKFCLYPVRAYLLSENFQWDQHTCEDEYQDAVSKHLKTFLELNRSIKDYGFYISLKGNPEE